MPELPEVETVRRGLATHVVGRTVAEVEVAHPRAVRRHPGGAADFAAALAGQKLLSAGRRGKYLWLPLSGGDALIGHLGMSGQLVLRPADAPPHPHLRVRFRFTDAGPQLWFMDQRTFGGLSISPYHGTGARPDRPHRPDPLDPRSTRRVRGGAPPPQSRVKVALLDQRMISGVGNIYADEALWRTSCMGSGGATNWTLRGRELLATSGTYSPRPSTPAGPRSTRCTWTSTVTRAGSAAPWRRTAGKGTLPPVAPPSDGAVRNRSSYSCPTCQRAGARRPDHPARVEG